MGGTDKGLLLLDKLPMIEHVYSSLKEQVESIRINANRSKEEYQQYAEVFSDDISGFQGPLAGIHASLLSSKSEWVGFTPCDAPNIPQNLVERLAENLDSTTEIYVAHDGSHPQPVFSIWNTRVLAKLEKFLANGDRKMKLFLRECETTYVDFSDRPETFVNLNTPEELDEFGRKTQ